MHAFEYQVIQVRQTPDANPFYVTSATASELLRWCDVPRSRDGFMAGYQRQLEGRHQKITEFFENDPIYNLIPNAVIIAVDPTSVAIADDASRVTTLTVSHDDKPIDELAINLLRRFESRLNGEELKSIDADAITDDDSVDDDSEDDAAVPPLSHLAELTHRLRLFLDTRASLSDEQSKQIVDYVRGVAKPGLILDGQHRVFGAKEVIDFDVEFPVVLLPGLEYCEQVFQFYVLNNKAKPLSRTHLRRIISTTLSRAEIDRLYDRLKHAGVEAKSAEWTHRMNNDSESPFRGLLDMGLNNPDGVIPENVAYQVISRFMLVHTRYRLLTDDVAEWDPNDNEYRLAAFYTLWRGIKDQYSDAWDSAKQSTATPQERQLFFKVSMLCLQEHLLNTWNSEMPKRKQKGEGSPLGNLDELFQEVSYTLPFLKETFFTKEWKVKGLDTSTGHDLFRKAITTAIQRESKNLGNMALFKG